MIVTIGRQHGSCGREVALALAERLKVPCYDKEIVDRTARDGHFSPEVVSTFDEKRVAPMFLSGVQFFGLEAGDGFHLNMQIASAQFDTIRKLASEGDAVFVGRCADYILRSRRDLLRVFITAEQSFRVQTLMKRRGIEEDQAKKLMKEVDRDRGGYYRCFTDRDWGDPAGYDLCLNMESLGVEGCVKTIVACLGALGLD